MPAIQSVHSTHRPQQPSQSCLQRQPHARARLPSTQDESIVSRGPTTEHPIINTLPWPEKIDYVQRAQDIRSTGASGPNVAPRSRVAPAPRGDGARQALPNIGDLLLQPIADRNQKKCEPQVEPSKVCMRRQIRANHGKEQPAPGTYGFVYGTVFGDTGTDCGNLFSKDFLDQQRPRTLVGGPDLTAYLEPTYGLPGAGQTREQTQRRIAYEEERAAMLQREDKRIRRHTFGAKPTSLSHTADVETEATEAVPVASKPVHSAATAQGTAMTTAPRLKSRAAKDMQQHADSRNENVDVPHSSENARWGVVQTLHQRAFQTDEDPLFDLNVLMHGAPRSEWRDGHSNYSSSDNASGGGRRSSEEQSRPFFYSLGEGETWSQSCHMSTSLKKASLFSTRSNAAESAANGLQEHLEPQPMTPDEHLDPFVTPPKVSAGLQVPTNGPRMQRRKTGVNISAGSLPLSTGPPLGSPYPLRSSSRCLSAGGPSEAGSTDSAKCRKDRFAVPLAIVTDVSGASTRACCDSPTRGCSPVSGEPDHQPEAGQEFFLGTNLSSSTGNATSFDSLQPMTRLPSPMRWDDKRVPGCSRIVGAGSGSSDDGFACGEEEQERDSVSALPISDGGKSGFSPSRITHLTSSEAKGLRRQSAMDLESSLALCILASDDPFFGFDDPDIPVSPEAPHSDDAVPIGDAGKNGRHSRRETHRPSPSSKDAHQDSRISQETSSPRTVVSVNVRLQLQRLHAGATDVCTRLSPKIRHRRAKTTTKPLSDDNEAPVEATNAVDVADTPWHSTPQTTLKTKGSAMSLFNLKSLAKWKDTCEEVGSSEAHPLLSQSAGPLEANVGHQAQLTVPMPPWQASATSHLAPHRIRSDESMRTARSWTPPSEGAKSECEATCMDTSSAKPLPALPPRSTSRLRPMASFASVVRLKHQDSDVSMRSASPLGTSVITAAPFSAAAGRQAFVTVKAVANDSAPPNSPHGLRRLRDIGPGRPVGVPFLNHGPAGDHGYSAGGYF